MRFCKPSRVLGWPFFFLAALARIIGPAGPVLGHTQSPTGTILGVVSDEHGGRIVGATVTVSEIQTGMVHSSSSNENGVYSIMLLPPGVYQVEVSKAGYAK